MTIWITRSVPAGLRLEQALQARQVPVLLAPVIEVEPLLPWDEVVPERTQRWLEAEPIRNLASPELVIALSAHAAEAYLQHCPQPTTVPHIGIGPSTTRVLAQHYPQVEQALRASSEGVAETVFKKGFPLGTVVWILAGAGGREVLIHQLDEAGYNVCKKAVYRRVDRLLGDLKAVTMTEVAGIEVASVQALHGVSRFWNHVRGADGITLFTASQRIETEARAVGFRNILNVDTADVSHTAQAVADWYSSR